MLSRPISALLAGLLVACTTPAPTRPLIGPRPQITSPADLCGDPSLGPGDFCMAVERMEALLGRGDGEILYYEITESGTSRPSVLYLGYAQPGGERIVIRAKWKIAPPGGTGFNNAPEREIAAYEAQKLFLDPADYVVPPIAGVCVPLELHTEALGPVDPTFPGTRCVFGVLAYWLENVHDDAARDLARVDRDPVYRDHLARLNLFTYLIDHRDPRDANFLIAKDPKRPRVFAIDNGLAFSGFQNPFVFYYGDWGDIRVPALRRADVERLRTARRADFERLAVVAQYAIRDGMLMSVPPGPPLAEDRSVRVGDGVIQFGLTRAEIDAMESRVRTLLERVDAGEVDLY